MPNPQTKSFIQKIVSNHANHDFFSPSRTTDDFSIRHFGQNVSYTPVNSTLYLFDYNHMQLYEMIYCIFLHFPQENFIENNTEVHSKHLCHLIENISNRDFNTHDQLQKTAKKTTYSGAIRIELESLISKLKLTVNSICLFWFIFNSPGIFSL